MLKSQANPLDMAEISTIEIYGSGSSFQSWATGISLLAR
jgi:hypothetical protein